MNSCSEYVLCTYSAYQDVKHGDCGESTDGKLLSPCPQGAHNLVGENRTYTWITLILLQGNIK